jgi:hypothetical protein
MPDSTNDHHDKHREQTRRFYQRISDASRLIPAAGNARLCHVFRAEDGGKTYVGYTWHHIIAWSVPELITEVPIPLTCEGWIDEQATNLGLFLIEDEDMLILRGRAKFANPDDAVAAVERGELYAEI